MASRAAGRMRPKVSQGVLARKPGTWSLMEEISSRRVPTTSHSTLLKKKNNTGPRQEASIGATGRGGDGEEAGICGSLIGGPRDRRPARSSSYASSLLERIGRGREGLLGPGDGVGTRGGRVLVFLQGQFFGPFDRQSDQAFAL